MVWLACVFAPLLLILFYFLGGAKSRLISFPFNKNSFVLHTIYTTYDFTGFAHSQRHRGDRENQKKKMKDKSDSK